ncbi:sugar nucleotide-binding protein [Rhodobacteraceae bacterium 2CG4]|uniref:Sugar nucleotide-binding protein n=1 Tax=Halovulum marinum TaxID=2662447 RepID=A0A6L5Z2F8_9RHOB|nr:sugar nucleotide-binding protein [Halovulum marinum]MSU90746.1 sugar nucleotide-binding protein [Halovulum marinum]
MERVTVFGGSGYLGRRIVRALGGQDGTCVRIAARHPDAAPPGFGAERMQADVTDSETVARAVEGSAAVVNAVSLYAPTRSLGYADVHVSGARNVAVAAARFGATLVHVSGIGADPQSVQRYVRARGAGEQAVRAVHDRAVIVRLSVLFSAHGGLVRQVLDVLQRSPVFPLFGRGETRLQPVHASDAAEAICRLTRSTEPAVFECAGPEIKTYRAIVQQVAAAAGRNPRLVPVPFALWHAAARGAELLPGPPLTRDQVALMQQDKVASPDRPGLAEAGVAPRAIGESLASRFGAAAPR